MGLQHHIPMGKPTSHIKHLNRPRSRKRTRVTSPPNPQKPSTFLHHFFKEYRLYRKTQKGEKEVLHSLRLQFLQDAPLPSVLGIKAKKTSSKPSGQQNHQTKALVEPSISSNPNHHNFHPYDGQHHRASHQSPQAKIPQEAKAATHPLQE